jgi:hypothetical protein
MGSGVHLYLSEEGADAEWLEIQSGYLRAELAELDVDNVSALPAGSAPPGSRAAGIAAAGGLMAARERAANGTT